MAHYTRFRMLSIFWSTKAGPALPRPASSYLPTPFFLAHAYVVTRCVPFNPQQRAYSACPPPSACPLSRPNACYLSCRSLLSTYPATGLKPPNIITSVSPPRSQGRACSGEWARRLPEPLPLRKSFFGRSRWNACRQRNHAVGEGARRGAIPGVVRKPRLEQHTKAAPARSARSGQTEPPGVVCGLHGHAWVCSCVGQPLQMKADGEKRPLHTARLHPTFSTQHPAFRLNDQAEPL